jgi:hypothetical protein
MKTFLSITLIFLLSTVFLVPADLPAARIISVSLCEKVDNSGTIPINIREQFSTNVPEIHAIVELSELQAGTRIRGAWISVDAIDVPNYEIDAAEIVINQSEGVAHFSLSRPNNGWPVGNYKLDIYLNGKLSTIASFSISSAAVGSTGGKAGVSPAYPTPKKSETDQSAGFNGQYSLNSQGVTLFLNLQQDARGRISGSISSSIGMQLQLEGEVQGEVAMGICSDNQGAVFFEAYFQGNQLVFSMIEPDQNNMPDYNRSQQLLFSRSTGSQPQAYPQTFPQPQQQRQPVGSGQEYLLQGTLCSWSGSSSGYGNSSYSSSTRVYFDGQGNFSYSSESSFSGDAGIAYGGNQGAGNGGTYRVVGNQVQLQFNDGTTGVAQINMQQDDGRITELMYEGTLYATGLCE